MKEFNIDVDTEDVLAEIKKKKSQRVPVREVCVCGHNAGSHSSKAKPGSANAVLWEQRGTDRCRPGRQECPCVGFELAAVCADVRLFRFKTSGRGPKHALFQGIVTARARDIEVSPAGDWSCFACKREDVSVVPVPLREDGRQDDKPAKINKLLCGDCIAKLDRSVLWVAPAEVDTTPEA